ncbi:hypothetical protein B0H16DRAFT_1691317, partial [Mycena metata]
MCLLISIPVVLLSGLSRLCAGQSQSQSAPNISAAMQNATIVQQDNSTNYYHFFDADGVEIGKYSSPEFHAALVPAADTWSCTKVTWAQFQSWNGGNFVTNMNDFLRTSGYRLAPGDAVSNPIRSLDAATSGAPGPLLFRCVDTSTPHKLYAPGIMECSELREATIRKSSTITGGPVNLRYTSGFSTTGIFTIKENRWVAQAPPVIERLRFTVPQIVQGSAAKDTSATIENTVGMRLEVGVSGETDGYVTAQAPPNSKCGLEVSQNLPFTQRSIVKIRITTTCSSPRQNA